MRTHYGFTPYNSPVAGESHGRSHEVTVACGPPGHPLHTIKRTRVQEVCIPHSPLPSDFYLTLNMPIESSPVKFTCNSGGKFSASVPPVKELCDGMDNEMRHRFVGPMPVEEFFKEFLPVQELSEEVRAALPGFEEIAKVKREKQMYNRFVRCLHLPVRFASLIVVLSLGPHRKLILYQDQSVQLVK